MPTPLQKSICATLHYFDIFDYPLTLLEIHRYLYKGNWWHNEVFDATLYDLVKELDAMNQTIGSHEGFYFFKGRESLVKTRALRYLAAYQKFRKALPVCEVLSLMPGVTQIYAVNTLAYANAKPSSDIDLLIITRPRRLWTARFFCVSFLKLLGRRPIVFGHQQKTGQISLFQKIRESKKNSRAFCLTFFLSQGSMDIQSVAKAQFDPYLVFWIAQALCIYTSDPKAPSLMIANRWIRRFLPNAREQEPTLPLRIRTHVAVPSLGALCEKWAEMFQRAVLPSAIKNAEKQNDCGVIMNERMLKFHLNDMRAQYAREFQNRLHTLNV